MTATYESVLGDLAAADERIVVMTAENRAAIRGLPAKLGGRFIDTGIAEQTMVGAAAGLALRGRIPICHALATFLTLRAYEFIRTDVGIAGLPVKLVGAVPGFLSDGNGPTHQAIEDVAILRGIPNMNLFCPADEAELVQGMPAIVASPTPWYVRFNGRPAEVEHQPFEIGIAETWGDGREVAILVYGTLFPEAMQARALLDAAGIGARVVNLRTVKPVDEAAIREALGQARLVVTVEDHFLCGGLFSIVAEVALKNRLTAEVLPVALDGHWFAPGRFAEVLLAEGFTGPQIAAKIRARLEALSRPGG